MHDVFIHPTAMIDEGAKIGSKCTIWHFSHIMSGASLGDSCNIGQNVMVAPRVIIGNNVKIQNNVSVYEGVVCEDDVFLTIVRLHQRKESEECNITARKV